MVTTTANLTLTEFLELPYIEESPAWELIDGQASQKIMPTSHHSILQKQLVSRIDGANSDYEAFLELRYVLSQNSVVPDIAVVDRNRLPATNSPIMGAPNWAIEILSPGQSTTKLIGKIQDCLNEGTELGWLLDSEEQVAMVLRPGNRLTLLRGNSVLPVLANLNLSLTVEEIFSWVR